MPQPSGEARAPWWFIIVIIAAALPALMFMPQAARVLEQAGLPGAGYTGWLYPAYVIVSGLCALLCYPQRKALALVLVALMVLVDTGLFITVSIGL